MTEVPRRSVWWYVASAAYWFSSSFKWFLVLAILPSKVNALVPDGEKNGAWGMVLLIGSLEAMIGPAICGYLSDRMRAKGIGRIPFVIAGALLTAGALTLMSQAQTMTALIIAYLLLQISDDIATGPYSALIPDLVPHEHRGFASGVRGLLDQSARIVGALTGLALGQNFTAMLHTISVVNVVCALVVAGVVKEMVAPSPPTKARVGSWLQPWRDPDFRAVFFSQFLVSLGFYMVYLYAQNFLVDVVGVPKAEAFRTFVILAVLLSLTAAIGSVLAGRKADQVGRKRVMLVSGWVMFAMLVPFAFVQQLPVIIALATLFGFGFGPFTATMWAMTADVVGESQEVAKDMGIWQSSVVVPQLMAGAIGLLIDSLNGTRSGLGYSVAFALAATIFLAGSLVVQRVKRIE